MNIKEWGSVMKLARSATNKALSEESKRHIGGKFDRLSYDVILYTDDPTSAVYFLTPDMADICGVSTVTSVCVMDEFPPASFEAVRPDQELPRVAALLLIAEGEKCPRCRKRNAFGQELCVRCDEVVKKMDNAVSCKDYEVAK